MHPRFLQRLAQLVIHDLESCPSPGKFQLLSALYVVLPPNYLVSTTERLRDIIFPAESEPGYFWCELWEELCLEVFGLDFTDSDWDLRSYIVLGFYPEGYERANKEGSGEEVREDGRRFGTSPGIEPLDVHYGRVEATRRCVPEDVLSHRLSCVAIAFYQYLCDFGSAWKKLAKPEGLHIVARKSVHRPWLTSRRTGRNLGRRSFLRRLQGETPSQGYKALQPTHISTYVKLAWTLKILHQILFMARKSNDLINHLSKAVIPYPVYILFPRHTRRVRRTMEAYLEKVYCLFWLSLYPNHHDTGTEAHLIFWRAEDISVYTVEVAMTIVGAGAWLPQGSLRKKK